MNSIPLDTGRLPSYRHSHMLRFHPYPRGSPAIWETFQAFDGPNVEEDVPLISQSDPGQAGDLTDNLHRAIHPHSQGVGDGKSSFRRSSFTSVVIDLALVVTQKSS
ncbi:hypothetical protein V8B97DRAFT_2006172 [Scleroderma yunnanense]